MVSGVNACLAASVDFERRDLLQAEVSRPVWRLARQSGRRCFIRHPPRTLTTLLSLVTPREIYSQCKIKSRVVIHGALVQEEYDQCAALIPRHKLFCPANLPVLLSCLRVHCVKRSSLFVATKITKSKDVLQAMLRLENATCSQHRENGRRLTTFGMSTRQRVFHTRT